MAIFKTKNNEDKPAATTKKAEAAKSKEEKKASMKDLYAGQSKGKAKGDETKVSKRGNAYRILVKPLITEKAAHESAAGKYHFEVSGKANKIEVAEAISEVYGIKPLAINIVSVKGKRVRHGRIMGQRSDWKKAIVTLPKGKTIKIYEGV